MAIRLDIKSELPTAIKWTNEHTKQLPFAISRALNATARGDKRTSGSDRRSIIADMERLTKRSFDRPKPQTVSSFFIPPGKSANKRNLSVMIGAKDRPYRRNRYLVGNIQGGSRPLKLYEREFAQRGKLPSGQVLVPTSIVKRDQYGNPKRTEIKALVRGLNKPEGKRGSAFVGRPDQGDRPFGVYKVVRKGSLRAYFIAQQGTSYGNPLAGIYTKANARAKQTFGPYLRQFLAQAVAENVKSGRADMRTGLFR